MAQAKSGDKVSINFIGKLADGTIIDSTYPDPESADDHESADHNCDDNCCHEIAPLTLTIGADEFYLPIEEALIGMHVGEKKNLTISPEDAFGDYNSEKVFKVSRTEFPEDEIPPEVGLELEVDDENDGVFMATIVKVEKEELTLDSNHPLAGEELTYEFELVEIF